MRAACDASLSDQAVPMHFEGYLSQEVGWHSSVADAGGLAGGVESGPDRGEPVPLLLLVLLGLQEVLAVSICLPVHLAGRETVANSGA